MGEDIPLQTSSFSSIRIAFLLQYEASLVCLDKDDDDELEFLILPSDDAEDEPRSSVTSSVFNLSNTSILATMTLPAYQLIMLAVVGAGILALPFAFKNTGEREKQQHACVMTSS